MASPTPKPKSLDIEEAVRTWAWREYDNTANRKQRSLRDKHDKSKDRIGLDIDWSGVEFHDETEWPQLAEEPFKTKEDENENKQGKENGVAEVAEHAVRKKTMKSETAMSHDSILFITKFTNNTDHEQEYTLKTEKTTCSTCSTEIESCVTKGVEMGITLKSPGEILECNAGYQREVSLTNVRGETFEEELNWGVESQITVKANHVAEASLSVTEKKYAGEFRIHSTVSGFVAVTFRNIRDNNSVFKATGHEITEIVKEYIKRENRKGKEYPFVTVTDDEVQIITKGNCKFRFGINQEVVVNHKNLTEEN